MAIMGLCDLDQETDRAHLELWPPTSAIGKKRMAWILTGLSRQSQGEAIAVVNDSTMATMFWLDAIAAEHELASGVTAVAPHHRQRVQEMAGQARDLVTRHLAYEIRRAKPAQICRLSVWLERNAGRMLSQDHEVDPVILEAFS